MLGGSHLILCQQKEHYTFPAIPKNIYHREISFINTQTNCRLETIPAYTQTEIFHLNATIFTKSTMYDWKHYVDNCSEMLCQVSQSRETLGKAANLTSGHLKFLIVIFSYMKGFTIY